MEILQRVLEEGIRGLPHEFLSQLVVKKLKAQGVQLSDRQQRLLKKHIREGGGNTLRFDSWKFWQRREVSIEFSARDLQQAEEHLTKFLEERLPGVIENVADNLSGKILNNLKKKWSAQLRWQRRQLNGFKKRLNTRWGKSIEGLQMLLTMSRELGARTNEALRRNAGGDRNNLVEVLTRSHARACQVVEEVICLVSSGLPDGAMARWRTLHEIAVISAFISANGEDVAERYVLHQVVESKKAADDYEHCRERLRYAPLEDDFVRELQISFAELKTRYGPEFTSQYGWAANILKSSKPTFRQIEEAAGVDQLRSHYRMASHPVHANPKGIFFHLGSNKPQILLAGPSNAGLVDPIQNSALSLIQITSSLCSLRTTLDTIIALKMMMQVQWEIGDALEKAQAQLEADSSKLGYSVQMC